LKKNSFCELISTIVYNGKLFMQKISEQFKNSIRLFLIGFSMGSADVVPGVSGGTIAFIFGIFEELVYSIKKVSGQVLKLILKFRLKEALSETPFGFLLPLMFGILTALFTLSGIISNLLQTQPVFIWSFFFGLLTASILVVRKRVVTWDKHDYVVLAGAALFAYFLVGSVPVQTPATYLAFFLSGMIAICAMILPGISGSFLLILMGKYEQVLEAVVTRDILVIGTVMLGAVLGLAIFSRFLSWLFARHHDIIVAALTGFMIGSLRKVWPFKEVVATRLNRHGMEVPLQEANYIPQVFDSTVFYALIFALIAMAIIFYLDRLKVTNEEIEVIGDPEYEKMHKKALRMQKHPIKK
jgi:putative membrane protein